ncbi:MAG: polyprenyl synthetase family protein [Parcubacteria group bacterium]|nr:polyprenyl synthetase family protein [Parcubacteria group bacterium]
MSIHSLQDYKEYADGVLTRIIQKRIHASSLPMERHLWRRYGAFLLAGGKRIRGYLAYLGFQLAGGSDQEKALATSLLLECTHATILLFDDIIDHDALRRGKPTVHTAFGRELANAPLLTRRWFGDSQAMVTGLISMTLPSLILVDAGWDEFTLKKALSLTATLLHEVGSGEALDTELAVTPWQKVRLHDIMRLYEWKTARYSVARPLEFGALLAGARAEFRRKLFHIAIPAGIAFQIADDLLGIFGDAKTLGKPIGSDLREGKRTIITTLIAYEGSHELKRVFHRVLGRSFPLSKISHVRTLLTKSDISNKAYEIARRLIAKSLRILATLEGKDNAAKKELSLLFRLFLTRKN